MRRIITNSSPQQVYTGPIAPMSKDDQRFWDWYNGRSKKSWWQRFKEFMGGFLG